VGRFQRATGVYEVRFANGDVETADSLRRARHRIRLREVEEHPAHSVLPAQITLRSEVVEIWDSFEALRAEP
jgi:hypothetical protein